MKFEMAKHSWFLWMIVAYLIATTGDVLVKKQFVWLGALLYACTTPFWVKVLQVKDLSSLAIISSVVGNTILLLGARIFLGEIMTPMQWVGIAIGMISLILLA